MYFLNVIYQTGLKCPVPVCLVDVAQGGVSFAALAALPLELNTADGLLDCTRLYLSSVAMVSWHRAHQRPSPSGQADCSLTDCKTV